MAADEPRTLFEKVWLPHVVDTIENGPDVLAIDLHLAHEVTSQEAFAQLAARGLTVSRPDRTLAVMDHVVPTAGSAVWTERATEFASDLVRNCARHGVPMLPYLHARQGIVHVIGPELGLTRPGLTIVCGDSHTSTHGAFGAVAFGIGTTQVGHVLASQALLVTRPKTMSVTVAGDLPAGVTGKDIALALIGRYGNQGGRGYAVEYRGEAIRQLSMEGRMSLCNMGVEFGARLSLIAPDETTFAYHLDTPFAVAAEDREAAIEAWSRLRTDEGAAFDREIVLDAAELRPYVSWGTNPAQVVPFGEPVPDPDAIEDEELAESARRALAYMDLAPGTDLSRVPIDAAFIGSCTNGRIEDLRAAAAVLRGRHVAASVTAIATPGSMSVKAQAEREGIDRVFQDAGFRWGTAGCSLCIAANGDLFGPGVRSASSTNRNFEGRQGTGARTHIMSPANVAASAVAGRLATPGSLEEAVS